MASSSAAELKKRKARGSIGNDEEGVTKTAEPKKRKARGSIGNDDEEVKKTAESKKKKGKQKIGEDGDDEEVLDSEVDGKDKAEGRKKTNMAINISFRGSASKIHTLLQEMSPGSRERFSKCCFGHLIDMPPFTVNRTLVCAVLRRYAKWDMFDFDGYDVRCSLKDIALITGLSVTQLVNPLRSDQGDPAGRLRNRYLGTGNVDEYKLLKAIRKLEGNVENQEVKEEDLLKMHMLYFICVFLLPNSQKNVDPKWIQLAEKLSRFNAHPWGFEVHRLLVDSFRHMSEKLGTRHFNAYGCLHVFTVWCYMHFPSLAPPCADRVYPRVLAYKLKSREQNKGGVGNTTLKTYETKVDKCIKKQNFVVQVEVPLEEQQAYNHRLPTLEEDPVRGSDAQRPPKHSAAIGNSGSEHSEFVNRLNVENLSTIFGHIIDERVGWPIRQQKRTLEGGGLKAKKGGKPGATSKGGKPKQAEDGSVNGIRGTEVDEGQKGIESEYVEHGIGVDQEVGIRGTEVNESQKGIEAEHVEQRIGVDQEVGIHGTDVVEPADKVKDHVPRSPRRVEEVVLRRSPRRKAAGLPSPQSKRATQASVTTENGRQVETTPMGSTENLVETTPMGLKLEGGRKPKRPLPADKGNDDQGLKGILEDINYKYPDQSIKDIDPDRHNYVLQYLHSHRVDESLYVPHSKADEEVTNIRHTPIHQRKTTLSEVLGVCKYLDEVDAADYGPFIALDPNLEPCLPETPGAYLKISPNTVATLKPEGWVVGWVFKWYALRLNRLVLSHHPVPPPIVVDNEFLLQLVNDYNRHQKNMVDKSTQPRYSTLIPKKQFQFGKYGKGWITQLENWDGKVTLVIPNNHNHNHNHNHYHWNVLQVDPIAKKIVVFDSTGRGNCIGRTMSRNKTTLNALGDMLKLFIAVKFPKKSHLENWRLQVDVDVPKQSTSFDCGIFSLMYMDLLCRENSCNVQVSKADIRNMRYLLASELLADCRVLGSDTVDVE